jgi:hypothetical protein
MDLDLALGSAIEYYYISRRPYTTLHCWLYRCCRCLLAIAIGASGTAHSPLALLPLFLFQLIYCVGWVDLFPFSIFWARVRIHI